MSAAVADTQVDGIAARLRVATPPGFQPCLRPNPTTTEQWAAMRKQARLDLLAVLCEMEPDYPSQR